MCFEFDIDSEGPGRGRAPTADICCLPLLPDRHGVLRLRMLDIVGEAQQQVMKHPKVL